MDPTETPERASIALVDETGVIVAVNQGWTDFCLANGGRLDACGPGTSYLEVCDVAGDRVSAAIARAIRQAVRGTELRGATFTLPCHSPTQERWFDIVVSPWIGADAGSIRGATVVLIPAAAPAAPVDGRGAPTGDDLVARLHRDVTGEVYESTLSICSVLDRIHDPLALERIERGVLALDHALTRLRRLAVQLELDGARSGTGEAGAAPVSPTGTPDRRG